MDEVIDVDVIYSSKSMIALQWEDLEKDLFESFRVVSSQDENGECDFYARPLGEEPLAFQVLTPVNDILEERDKWGPPKRCMNNIFIT